MCHSKNAQWHFVSFFALRLLTLSSEQSAVSDNAGVGVISRIKRLIAAALLMLFTLQC